MIRDPKPASRPMPQNLRKVFPALAAVADGRRLRETSRGPTASQCDVIRDLHALCVSAADIAKRLRLSQAVVVDEIRRLSGINVDV